jgi:hypothetical protein
VRFRTNVTKGHGLRAAGIAIAHKLIDAPQTRWRAVNAPHLVALVRAGATLHRGNCSTDPATSHPTRQALSRNRGTGGRLKLADPQVLTISLCGHRQLASRLPRPRTKVLTLASLLKIGPRPALQCIYAEPSRACDLVQVS